MSWVDKTSPFDGSPLLFFLCFVESFGGWCSDFVRRVYEGGGGVISCVMLSRTKRCSHNYVVKPADYRIY